VSWASRLAGLEVKAVSMPYAVAKMSDELEIGTSIKVSRLSEFVANA
jgi:hypothetical protein